MGQKVVSNKKLKTGIAVVLIALIFIIICVAFGIKVVNTHYTQLEIGENNQTQVESEEEKIVPKDTTINLVAIGDIMCHKTNFKAAYDAKTGTYDFSPVFVNIAKYITKADIAIRKPRNYLCRSSCRI